MAPAIDGRGFLGVVRLAVVVEVPRVIAVGRRPALAAARDDLLRQHGPIYGVVVPHAAGARDRIGRHGLAGRPRHRPVLEGRAAEFLDRDVHERPRAPAGEIRRHARAVKAVPGHGIAGSGDHRRVLIRPCPVREGRRAPRRHVVSRERALRDDARRRRVRAGAADRIGVRVGDGSAEQGMERRQLLSGAGAAVVVRVAGPLRRVDRHQEAVAGWAGGIVVVGPCPRSIRHRPERFVHGVVGEIDLADLARAQVLANLSDAVRRTGRVEVGERHAIVEGVVDLRHVADGAEAVVEIDLTVEDVHQPVRNQERVGGRVVLPEVRRRPDIRVANRVIERMPAAVAHLDLDLAGARGVGMENPAEVEAPANAGP